MNFIKNIQNKSDSVKQTIIWVGAFLIMTVIFTGWLLTFSWQLTEPEDARTAVLKNELPSAWTSIKNQISALFEVLGKINPNARQRN